MVLFIKKYNQVSKNNPLQLKEKLDETEFKLQQSETKLIETAQSLQQSEQKLEQFNLKITHYKKHFYCRYCDEELKSAHEFKTHESSCTSNPKNKILKINAV